MASVDMLNDSQKLNYNSYILAAKSQKTVEEALQCYQKAFAIHPTPKLEMKINKLMKAIGIKDTDDTKLLNSDNKRPLPSSPSKVSNKRRSPPLQAPSIMDVVESQKENISPTGSPVKASISKLDLPSLLSRAKKEVQDGNLKTALECYRRAHHLQPNQKLENRIARIESFLCENPEQSSTSSSASTSSPSRLNPSDTQRNSVTPDIVQQTSQLKISDESRSCIKTSECEKTGDVGYAPIPDVDNDDVSALLAKAKMEIDNQNVPLGLRCYLRANDLQPSEKLQRRIERMKAYLNSNHDESKSENCKQDDHAENVSSDAPSKSSESPSASNKMAPSEGPDFTDVSEVHSSSPMSVEEETNKATYNSLISQAKDILKAGLMEESLEIFRKANKLYPSDKLQNKISRLESVVSNNGNETADDDHAAIEAHYNQLLERGKQLIKDENIKEALDVYNDAYQIKPSERLMKKIQKISQYLEQQEQQEQSSSTSVSSPQDTESSSDSSADRYNELIKDARQFVHDDKVKEALKLFKEAYAMVPTEKLKKKIDKCEEYLRSNGEDNSGEFAHVGNGFYLHEDLYDKLYPHQRESLLWFWGLHKKKRGGILADDMGLGKTIQVISFLCGLFDADEVKNVLIVMPLSLIENWRREFEKWAPGLQVCTYHGSSIRERTRNVSRVQRRGGVLLTSYGMIVSSASLLSKKDGESLNREFTWDYVILDEGHKIKNPTKTSKGVHLIAAKHRIILTGTPVQNNLKEMWALFDWTHHGMLLGTSRTFKLEYEKPITRAREKCATFGERRLGEHMAESLKRIIAPYFLRRTKQEVKLQTKERIKQGVAVSGPEMPNLTRKNDFVVWCYLSQLQEKIYDSFTAQPEIKELLNTSHSPLTALTVLKKICDHPRLMSNNACYKLGLFTPDELENADDDTMKDCAANRIRSIDDTILVTESGKLEFLVQLMSNLKQEGHRTLIFSQSRKMLDIIQKVLGSNGHVIMRMDGTITDIAEREKCVNVFQSTSNYDTFLLTTQVGGVGLTLTAADRVVIYDPAWNPATDSQAVDRAFRIGQQKNVVIYRLISCGTVEEKIYRRQVFKDSVTRQTMQQDAKNLYRYFTKTELHELFNLDDPRTSKTQQQLEQMHASHRVTDTALDEHIAYLYSCAMFGLSDHDLMFSQEDEELEGGDDNVEYIEQRVNQAVELLTRESENHSKLLETGGRYVPEHFNAVNKLPRIAPYADEPTSVKSETHERLLPEYNYQSSADLWQRPGDWRDHVRDNPPQNQQMEDEAEIIASDMPYESVQEVSSTDVSTSNTLHTSVRDLNHQADAIDLTADDISLEEEANAVKNTFIDPIVIDDEISFVADNPTSPVAMEEEPNSVTNSLRSVSPRAEPAADSGLPTSQLHNSSPTKDTSLIAADTDEESVSGRVVEFDSEDVIADDSTNEVAADATGSGSMLGDDFGNLHLDYTVKDSEDEEASFKASPNKRRRSTYLQPIIAESDDEVDLQGDSGAPDATSSGDETCATARIGASEKNVIGGDDMVDFTADGDEVDATAGDDETDDTGGGEEANATAGGDFTASDEEIDTTAGGEEIDTTGSGEEKATTGSGEEIDTTGSGEEIDATAGGEEIDATATGVETDVTGGSGDQTGVTGGSDDDIGVTGCGDETDADTEEYNTDEDDMSSF